MLEILFPVYLHREPGNARDSNAIMAYIESSGTKHGTVALGHLEKEVASVIAPMMDTVPGFRCVALVILHYMITKVFQVFHCSFFMCRSTVSGEDISTNTCSMSYKYRATDILISIGSHFPLQMQSSLTRGGIQFEVSHLYQVYDVPLTLYYVLQK